MGAGAKFSCFVHRTLRLCDGMGRRYTAHSDRLAGLVHRRAAPPSTTSARVRGIARELAQRRLYERSQYIPWRIDGIRWPLSQRPPVALQAGAQLVSQPPTPWQSRVGDKCKRITYQKGPRVNYRKVQPEIQDGRGNTHTNEVLQWSLSV